jgi:hypothetical protein
LSDSEQLVETDDLDLFSKQLFGAKESPEVKAEEPKPTSDEDSDEEVDDDTVAEDDASPEPDADADEDLDGDDDKVDEPKGKKNRKSFQERINELTAKNKETERLAAVERAEMARRFAELEAKLTPKETAKAPAGAPDPTAEKADGEPIYPLGEFDPQYIRDLTRFTIAQEQEAAEKYRAKKDQEAQEAAIRARVAEHWSANLVETEKELPDLREKINSLEVMFTGLDSGYAQYLVDLVMTLENGPRILHYLGDNPKEAQEIVSSGAAAATAKLGKLDGRMTKVPVVEAPAKKVSKAPEPPKSTRGTGGKFSTAADTDDLDAFSKMLFR